MIRLAALLLLAATPAAAHGTLPGGGGFQAGFLHPLLAGDHLLVCVGLGGLMGRHGARRSLLALLMGLILGFGLTPLSPGPLQPAILVLALAIGAALAAALPLGNRVIIAVALATGALIGADTDGPAGDTALAAYAGVVAAVFLIVLNIMALAHAGAGRLNGVPLRVAGSWIAAAAILVLAFLLRESLGSA